MAEVPKTQKVEVKVSGMAEFKNAIEELHKAIDKLEIEFVRFNNITKEEKGL